MKPETVQSRGTDSNASARPFLMTSHEHDVFRGIKLQRSDRCLSRQGRAETADAQGPRLPGWRRIGQPYPAWLPTRALRLCRRQDDGHSSPCRAPLLSPRRVVRATWEGGMTDRGCRVTVIGIFDHLGMRFERTTHGDRSACGHHIRRCIPDRPASVTRYSADAATSTSQRTQKE